MDLIDDIVEVANATIALYTGMGESCNEPLLQPETRAGPFNGVERSWFMMDMDGDGLLNGPSDWDTDGDGMPDGFGTVILIPPWRPTLPTCSTQQTLPTATGIGTKTA